MIIKELAKELGVSEGKLMRTLRAKNSKDIKKLTFYSKLTEEEILFLKETIPSLIPSLQIDMTFQFTKEDIDDNRNAFKSHLKLLTELNLLEQRAQRYWALDKDEINILIDLKKSRLKAIQVMILDQRNKRIESNKIKNNSRDANRISRDPYERFHWGGLSGEEAYIGYWNTQ